MTFLHPTILIALAAVGAAAVLALLRPGRQMIVVATVALWRQTLNSPDAAHTPRTRRLTLHWLLLLAGALAAVLAASQPVHYATAPARAVAVVLYPSAELATPAGMGSLRQAAGALLARLDEGDRVAVIAPGAAGQWTSVAQARQSLADLSPWPLEAAEMTLTPPSDAQRVYRIVPAGAAITGGPGETLIEIPTSMPDVTFDALAAAADGNEPELFVAIRNNTDRPCAREICIAPAEANPGCSSGRIEVPEHQRREVTLRIPPGEPALHVAMIDTNGPTLDAFLVPITAHPARVAMVGADEPAIRRFIGISRELVLAGDANDADVLVCSGVNPPAGKAALVIQAPAPPLDLSPGPTLHDVVLGELTLHATDASDGGEKLPWPDLKATAVHLLPTWAGRGSLATLGPQGEAFFAADARSPRRVYVSFSLGAQNTNFALTPDFVKFLADAFVFLDPQAGQATAYQWQRPVQLAAAGLRLLKRAPQFSQAADSPHPWPGLYADEANGPVAVNLIGLRAAAPSQEPAGAIAALSLPARAPVGQTTEYWPFLAAAAMLLWLAGWLLRVR